MSYEAWVVMAAVLAVGVLLTLIIVLKVQEFLALLLTTLAFGLAVGNGPTELMDLVVGEMGDSLGQLSLVIALGAIFGMVLQHAGAAERIAVTLVERFSDRTISWGLGLAGFLVATSVYIDVAIVVLVPMLYGVAQRTGKSLLHYGIPLCAGLSAAYTFMPPAPGPLAASGIMGADIGLVVLFGAVCGIPAVAVAGPLFGRFIARRIHVVPPAAIVGSADPVAPALTTPSTGTDGSSPATATSTVDVRAEPERDLPSFGSVVLALLMPLLLILVGTVGRLMGGESPVATTLTFVGNPVMALLLTVLFSMWVFGVRRGIGRAELGRLAGTALGPAGNIILVTGAGGVFGGVLVSSGLGDTLSAAMRDASIPLVVFGFVVAAVMRISQGSGLVAMVTGATFSAPLAESLGASPTTVALTCIAIACGGAGFSHVNDSGFWMANRYFGMNVADTLKSWTVMKSLVGLTGFAVVLLLSPFVS
ncbi:GntP family permease [Pseudonocardia kunmingensis]|uniref:Gnt-I system low-affinity gluconate transporter n=1 Tax=Pseudonocardia kunmingensis TaxID=630975 RepID=A0A543DQV2_9PSEU|nr:gluconate:H+ symporter [Pseudonocardia kunmingensis]TQM11707.1 Gnt-I system low-affinity gluconate transporter [Pseudonocardia kunmingensis]